jgi:hypothetical protein
VIRHIVLFNPREDAIQAEIDAVIRAARAMPGQIPGVRNFAVSTSFEVVQPPRYRYALTMEFDDEATARAYIDHPVHQRFREIFVPLCADRQVTTLREVGATEG